MQAPLCVCWRGLCIELIIINKEMKIIAADPDL